MKYRFVSSGEGFIRKTEANWESSLEFELATRLLERGMYTGEAKGEDSAGRSVLDVMDIERVVHRAMAIAEIFVAAADEKGWVSLKAQE